MATLQSQRYLRATLRLPPALRAAAFQSRAFSSTPARRLTVVDIAVAGPNAVINGIHALGVPWYAAIPLTAALVRGTFVYYFASLPARKQAQTRALLFPLINAKADTLLGSRYARDVERLRESSGTKIGRAVEYTWLQWKAKNDALRETGKPFGAPRGMFNPRSLLNFGVLIAFTEAIRLKCGSHQGLLPLLLSPIQWLAQRVDPERFSTIQAPEEMQDSGKVLAGKLGAAFDASQSGGQPSGHAEAPGTSHASEILNEPSLQQATTTQLSPLADASTPSAYFDLSLTTEGLASFLDLTVPDTSFVLPAMLGLVLLRSAASRSIGGKQGEAGGVSFPVRTNNLSGAVMDYFQQLSIGERFRIFAAVSFVVISMKLPAAIMLYIIPSFALGWLQGRWLDFKHPIPQPIKKCQRSLRRKAKRQWSGERR